MHQDRFLGLALHHIEQQVARSLSGRNRYLAQTQPHGIGLRGHEVETRGVGRAPRIVAMPAIGLQVRARAGVQRAARWIVPHGHLRRTIRRRRALQIADLGPVSELVEAAFGIVEILVEVARLGTDGRHGLGAVVTAFTLVGVGDYIVDGVPRPGWVHPVHGGWVGGDIESSFGLFPVPYIRQSDPAGPAVHQQACLDDALLAALVGVGKGEGLGEDGTYGEVEGLGVAVSCRSARWHPDEPVLSRVVGEERGVKVVGEHSGVGPEGGGVSDEELPGGELGGEWLGDVRAYPSTAAGSE